MTGAELAERRQALGLSQNQLAKALGVPNSTILRWERGDLAIERPTMLHLALENIEARAYVERQKQTK